MSRGERRPSADEEERDGLVDPVATLATALAGYIDDIERDSRTCLREEAVATAAATVGDLRLSWVIPCKRAALAHLREALGTLPGWKESHFWASDRTRLEALENQPWVAAGVPGREPVVRRDISWEGRPILVAAVLTAESKQMTLELLVPEVYREWPELPLRRVADAIRCRAALVPHDLVRAVPRASLPEAGGESIAEFLTRAMPPKLYASQCFALLREQN